MSRERIYWNVSISRYLSLYSSMCIHTNSVNIIFIGVLFFIQMPEYCVLHTAGDNYKLQSTEIDCCYYGIGHRGAGVRTKTRNKLLWCVILLVLVAP